MFQVAVVKIALLIIASVTSFAIAKCLYNAFFHPLRKYPGPFFAGVTRAYYLYWDIGGRSHWKVKEWHEKYGDVVRIAPDELSYTSGQAWTTIYGFPNKEGTGNFEKDAQWWNKEANGVNNVLTADDEGHRRMRRLQNPAFSDKALKAQESVIAGYISLLMQQLHGQASSPYTSTVDIVAWYNFTTFDVIGDLAFGEPFYCLRDAEWHWWIKAVFDIFQAGTYLRAARRFPRPLADFLTLCIPRELLKTRITQFMFSVERVKKRMTEVTDRPDFMSHILQASDEKGMSEGEIFVAAQLLIVAGSETTATALCSATYLLASNPSIFGKLAAEIRSSFTEETEITMQNVSGLKYLNAVVEEALRLGPPGPGTFPRVVPPSGKMVCGEWVPGGTAVGVHILATNRSSRNFKNADEFHPERWLGDEEFEEDKRSACNPFSVGARNCIGKSLAMAEIRMVIARMVWNFDMELPKESVGWLERQKMYTTWQKDEMKLKLIARNTTKS